MDLELNKSDMSGLSEEQTKAVLESLFIAVGVDRALDPNEAKKFEDEVRKIPWPVGEKVLSATIVGARDRINESRQPDQWLGWIAELAAKIPPEIRVKVLGTMTRLAFVNGLQQRERNILNAFIQAFELSEETVLELRKEFGVDDA